MTERLRINQTRRPNDTFQDWKAHHAGRFRQRNGDPGRRAGRRVGDVRRRCPGRPRRRRRARRARERTSRPCVGRRAGDVIGRRQGGRPPERRRRQPRRPAKVPRRRPPSRRRKRKRRRKSAPKKAAKKAAKKSPKKAAKKGGARKAKKKGRVAASDARPSCVVGRLWVADCHPSVKNLQKGPIDVLIIDRAGKAPQRSASQRRTVAKNEAG